MSRLNRLVGRSFGGERARVPRRAPPPQVFLRTEVATKHSLFELGLLRARFSPVAAVPAEQKFYFLALFTPYTTFRFPVLTFSCRLAAPCGPSCPAGCARSLRRPGCVRSAWNGRSQTAASAPLLVHFPKRQRALRRASRDGRGASRPVSFFGPTQPRAPLPNRRASFNTGLSLLGRFRRQNKPEGQRPQLPFPHEPNTPQPNNKWIPKC